MQRDKGDGAAAAPSLAVTSLLSMALQPPCSSRCQPCHLLSSTTTSFPLIQLNKPRAWMLSAIVAWLQEKARGQATFLHGSAVLGAGTCWALALPLPLHALPLPCWLCACQDGFCLVGLLFPLAGTGIRGFLRPPDSPLHQLLGFCWWSVTLRICSPQGCHSPTLMKCVFMSPLVKTLLFSLWPRETWFCLSAKSSLCNYFLA